MYTVTEEEETFCQLGSFPRCFCFWLARAVSHTRVHTPAAAVSDHMHSYNTTGCCRVDVWGAKFHINCNKQYWFLRTIHLLIIAAVILIFYLFSWHPPHLKYSYIRRVWTRPDTHERHQGQKALHFTFADGFCKANGKGEDKQKDNHYYQKSEMH